MSLSPSDLWVGDEGVYICEAQNQFGKIQTQASVAVTGLGKKSLLNFSFLWYYYIFLV